MSLTRALIKRAFDRFLLILVMVVLVFILVRVVPTYVFGEDPFWLYIRAQMMPGEPIEALIDEYKKLFGLGEPLFPNQFLKYLHSLFTLNFGSSLIRRRAVIEEFAERLPNTLALNILTVIFVYAIGFSLGWYTVTKRGKGVESAIMSVSIWSYIMPGWLMGILFIILFAYIPRVAFDLKIFPMPPYTPPRLPTVDFLGFKIPIITIEYLWYLSLPVIALVVAAFGGLVYYTRQLTVSELGQDYILTAKAKGLSEMTIMRKHVFRNVLPPVITMIGFAIPGLFTGSILVETVFSYYGMGLLLWEALQSSDYPIVQSWFFIYAIMFSISLYIVDIIMIKIDPRVRLR